MGNHKGLPLRFLLKSKSHDVLNMLLTVSHNDRSQLILTSYPQNNMIN
jgi:hypothetical protein